MKLYIEKEQYKLYHGNMLDMLEVISSNSIDSIVTDPPYELNFMGKGWDNTGIAFQKGTWQKCYEVLKPGGYLLAFGGTRTYHRIACAIEDAGFEIRDCIMYLYGSGFPKSMNIGLAIDKKKGVESIVVGKDKSGKSSHAFQSEETTTAGEYEIKQATNEWNGWGTALKPAYEPIIVARKPFKTSIAENIMQYGVGGINIDECRIPFEDTQNPATNPLYRQQNKDKYKQIEKGQESEGAVNFTSSKNDISNLGRFPSNVIHDGSEEATKDMPNTNGFYRPNCVSKSYKQSDNVSLGGGNVSCQYNDEGSASRYFYTAKASKKDRDEGLDMFENYYELKPNIPQEIINKIKTLLNY